MHPLSLPTELNLEIAKYLSWRDLYSLIKSNRRYAATHLNDLLPLAAREDGPQLLLWASKAGDEQLLRLLLDTFNIPVNPQPSRQHVTALHLAAQNGHLNIVRILIEKGASLHQTCRGLTGGMLGDGNDDDPAWTSLCRVTPIHLAAYNGHEHIMRELVTAGANPNDDGNFTLSPLELAAVQGNVGIVRMLVTEMQVDDPRSLALARAINPTWHDEIIDLILQNTAADAQEAIWKMLGDAWISTGGYYELEQRLSQLKQRLKLKAMQFGRTMDDYCTHQNIYCGCIYCLS